MRAAYPTTSKINPSMIPTMKPHVLCLIPSQRCGMMKMAKLEVIGRKSAYFKDTRYHPAPIARPDWSGTPSSGDAFRGLLYSQDCEEEVTAIRGPVEKA